MCPLKYSSQLCVVKYSAGRSWLTCANQSLDQKSEWLHVERARRSPKVVNFFEILARVGTRAFKYGAISLSEARRLKLSLTLKGSKSFDCHAHIVSWIQRSVPSSLIENTQPEYDLYDYNEDDLW